LVLLSFPGVTVGGAPGVSRGISMVVVASAVALVVGGSMLVVRLVTVGVMLGVVMVWFLVSRVVNILVVWFLSVLFSWFVFLFVFLFSYLTYKCAPLLHFVVCLGI